MVIFHTKIIRWLSIARSNDAFPSTLLFYGQKGVGTSDFALFCAQWLQQDVYSFEEIIAKDDTTQNPDIITLYETTIADVRSLRSKVARTPFSGSMRIVLIHDVDTLNRESANALLKILEEPAPKTVFILTSTHKERILATIRSRATSFYFAPVSQRSIAQALPTSAISDISFVWDGKPTVAQELLASTEQQEHIRTMVRDATLWLTCDLNTKIRLMDTYYETKQYEDFLYTIMLVARNKGVSASTYRILQQGIQNIKKISTTTANVPFVLRLFSLHTAHQR